MKYKLEIDIELNLTWDERVDAYGRLARFGNWNHLRDWWIPHKSLVNPQLKIKREGFIITERRL